MINKNKEISFIYKVETYRVNSIKKDSNKNYINK